MTQKYLRISNNKRRSNAININEMYFRAFFLISLSMYLTKRRIQCFPHVYNLPVTLSSEQHTFKTVDHLCRDDSLITTVFFVNSP